MKYLIYQQDYDTVIFLKITDDESIANQYVEKLGYGDIVAVDEIDIKITLDATLNYCGSCTVYDFKFDPNKLHFGGQEPHDDHKGSITYNRYSNNLYFNIDYIAAKSIDEVRNIVIPQIEAAIEIERQKPTPQIVPPPIGSAFVSGMYRPYMPGYPIQCSG